MLWLGVHCPQLPLEVFVRRDSGRRESGRREDGRRESGRCESAEHEPSSPRVVVEDGRVMLCDPAAAATGIVPGSTLATAHSIAPALLHYRRSPGEELRQLRRLGEALYRFSPQVSLVPPAGIALEIGASLRLFGGVEAISRAAAAVCGELGHIATCRHAATPLAALTLARADTPSLSEAPLPAAAIEPASLAAATLEQLGNMGIHTLGQLLALPSDGLAERFGQTLVDYLQRLTGARPDPRRFLPPATRFRRQLHLLTPVRNKAALTAPMTRLLTELQHWLIAHQLGVEQLRWQFEPAGRGLTPVVLTVRFAQPQQNQARLFEISQLQLAQTALPEEVLGLGLNAERLRPWSADSQALFRHLSGGRSTAGDGGRLGRAQLAELGALVDRLEARLGRGVCWSLQVQDQHVPEAAWQPVDPLQAGKASAAITAGPSRRARPRRSGKRPVPATETLMEKPPAKAVSPCATGKAEGRCRAPAPSSIRPLWLFAPPQPISSTQLTLLRGPERIETGWWNGDDRGHDQGHGHGHGHARDYYVARLSNGAEGWVFVDTRSRWFLHGYFG